MKITLAHDHYNLSKLKQIIAEMRIKGAPTIRVVIDDCGNSDFRAIEGCHRLRAAAALKLRPRLKIINKNTKIKSLKDMDYDGIATTAGEIGDWENEMINFDDLECSTAKIMEI